MKVTKVEQDEMCNRYLGDLVEVIQNGVSFMCVATFDNFNYTLVRLDGVGTLKARNSGSSIVYEEIKEASLTSLIEALRNSKSVTSFTWYSNDAYELVLKKKDRL